MTSQPARIVKAHYRDLRGRKMMRRGHLLSRKRREAHKRQASNTVMSDALMRAFGDLNAGKD